MTPASSTTRPLNPETFESPCGEDKICGICQGAANGCHFDAISCSACAAFFRRCITASKKFNCITGYGSCRIHYSMPQICRYCRFQRCLENGMNPKSVQNRRRDIIVVTSLAKTMPASKKKTALYEQPSPPNWQANDNEIGDIPSTSEEQFAMQYIPTEIKQSSPNSEASYAASDENNYKPIIIRPSQVLGQIQNDVLHVLIKEEMRLGERRRMVFCERPVEKLLGQNPFCPFDASDIKPLCFQDFRKSIRIHILFIYEWLQAWPDFATLSCADRVSFLRKCVLFHTILDPVYISLQCGFPDKFVMQNGGYVSCNPNCNDGWEDESEISGEIKRMIYKPLLDRIMTEIVPPLQSFKITYAEFVALKAIVSFQGAIENVSTESRPAMKKQLDAVIDSLHKHYIKEGYAVEERLGTIILLLSPIFTVGLEFVESHRTIDIFDLWHLDSLLRQLLNLDAIFQQGAFHNDSAFNVWR